MGLLDKSDVGDTDKYKTAVEVFLEDYAKKNGAFHGIIFRYDMHVIFDMISHFGSVLELDNGNCLVMIPRNIDRQLLVHRLSKSLKITPLYQCAAEYAVEAMISLTAFM